MVKTESAERNRSLDVLDLLADSFELFLYHHHISEDRGIICLAAGGIRLTNHFLKKKPETLPYWIGTTLLDGLPERSNVRIESVQLFRDVELVRKYGDLLRDSLLIDVGARRELLH